MTAHALPMSPDRPARAAPRPRALERWLWFVAAMIVAMVVIGGITRLTESGLSITEWKPVSGALPPLTEADWDQAFALYKQTTEFQRDHSWMAMADFKQIFFWEWLHRLWGRLIGLAYALPLAWFAWKRAIPAGFGRRLFVLLLLGGMQGAVGWWMVSSGLVGRTDVSHYRLAAHLLLALALLGGVVWTALDLRTTARLVQVHKARLVRFGLVALAVLFVQLLWGAYTAGLNAGYAFSSWPLMGDSLFPANVPMVAPWLLNLVDNPVVVQFIHRWLAFVAGGVLIALGVKAMRGGARGAGIVLHTLVLVQIGLGIATLLTGVNIVVAVAHQGCAALLVMAAVWAAHSLGQRATAPA